MVVEKRVIQKRALTDLVTAGVETRSGLRPGAVDEYARVLRSGGTLPPGVVYVDGDGTNWLAVGHHRKAAHERAGEARMLCEIRHGNKWDAVRAGIESNLAWHGERITLADRQHNVKRVLAEQPGMSDAAIASLVGVSPKTVYRHRNEARTTTDIVYSGARIGQDGRTYNVENIGRKAAPASDTAEQATTAPAVVAVEGRCACHEWESDGNGGRYCPACGENHPLGPSVPFEDALPVEPATAIASVVPPNPSTVADDWDRPVCQPAAKPADGAKLCMEAHKRIGFASKAVDALGDAWPGPHYQRTVDALGEADKRLSAWEAAENTPSDEQCSPPMVYEEGREPG